MKIAENLYSVRYDSDLLKMTSEINMPILFFIFIGILTAIFWEYVNSNIAIIGSISTALAFMATAWAALEARASAKAAMKAVEITANSLLETKKTSFKQWLELLLEQHDSLYDEVRKELDTDSGLKLKIDMNIASAFYYSLTKKQTLIKYINLIISILNYIDQEFNKNTINIDERNNYIEQLSHRINSNVKLAIATLGLQIDNSRTFAQEKLYSLLTKYDFFENEPFFEKTFEQINSLDHYITITFNNEYRSSIECYVNLMIQERKNGISNPIKNNYSNRLQRLDFVIYWAYKNICGDIIRKAFNELPILMRNYIEYRIENALEETKKIISSASNLIGCTIDVSTSKKITLRNERHLVHLVYFYFKNRDKISARTTLISGSTSNIYLDQLVTKMEDYKLNISFLKLKDESEKNKTIDDIIKIVEELINGYQSSLDKYISKKYKHE
ncbi:hypothetical protein [Enterobacter cloacae]|uniref:hypothetical protein n=1 Tax=Enterobacter cloacae TaxID=550 RepID=UPI00188B89D4|nr:hypothetical protein [Enterobacter cloacae]MBF4159236.1 hypothetical protein [Enterobacter cloacae]MDQ7214762.1 hypothetical protein [Enterobacter cloacae]